MKMMCQKYLFRLLPCAVVLCVGLVFALASCTNRMQEKRRTIMVSIEPLRFFTEQIVGNQYVVKSVVPENYNPESYKPTAKQLMELSNSDVFFKIGHLGFETTWLGKVQTGNSDVLMVNTSDGLFVSDSGNDLHTFDPHTWTSPQNVTAICQVICETMCKRDSANADVYKDNLKKLLQKINNTDKEIRNILSKCPVRTFITVHPSLTYFAEAYQLRQLSIEKDGKEPAPSDLRELIHESREKGPYPILVQKQFSKTQAEIVLKETGARMAYINPLGYNWNEEMRNIAKALCNE